MIIDVFLFIPIGSMYAIYGNIYHQYTPNVSIYTIHGSYGIGLAEIKIGQRLGGLGGLVTQGMRWSCALVS